MGCRGCSWSRGATGVKAVQEGLRNKGTEKQGAEVHPTVELTRMASLAFCHNSVMGLTLPLCPG